MKRSKSSAAMVAGVAILLFASGASAASFRFSNQTLTVPDGFEVEAVAGSPLVDRPVVGSFDDQGRLYLADSSGSKESAQKQLEEKPHRIIRLEDSDGDGRFDKSTVFADKLMFPEGCLWADGSVYVGAPPSIWKLTDTDGDGVADRREEWHQGMTLTGCANDLHGPYLGTDGWIYWCKGAFAEQNYTLGNGKPFKSRAAHIFRKRPDGSQLDVVMTGGMDNPVDVVFLPGGERIFSTTFFQRPGGGQRDGLIHAIYGGLYGKVNDVLDDHKKTGDLMPVLAHMGPAAACGLTRYESRVFGAEYQDNLFACQFNMHKVTRHQLTPAGASYRSKDSDFLVSDSPDFHPTDVLEDADGSLLVIDTGGWYKLCCPTAQLAKPDVLGNIFRVRRHGAHPVDDPRGARLNWAKLKPAELTRLLADARPAVRTRAIQRLAQQGTNAIAALERVVQKSDSADARRNAVWALTQMDTPGARPAARRALSDRDETVRQAAAHSAAVWRDHGAVEPLLTLLKGTSAPNRRVAAEALGRVGDSAATPALLSACADFGMQDRCHDHSLLFALIESADRSGVQSALNSDNLLVRRAALIALDQMEGGGLPADEVTPLLSSTTPLLRETAFWIVSHRPEWGGSLVEFARRRLAEGNLAAADKEGLERLFSQLSRHAAIQEVFSRTLEDKASTPEARLLVLRAMATAGLKEAPTNWLNALSRVVGTADPALQRQAVSTARSISVPKSGHPELAAALLAVGRNEKAPVEVRLDALAAVPGGLPNLEPGLSDFLRAHLDRTEGVNRRIAAVSVLAKAQLTPEQLMQLTETLRAVGPLEMPRILPLFDKCTNEALGLKLVAVLRETKGTGLRADLIKAALANFPEPVRRQEGELLKLINADVAKQAAHLEALLGEMKGGDIRRGQLIFNSAKAACAACHAIGYLGGRVGPDLTSIGQVRTERDLLESIVYPSASFVRSFEPMVVVTKSGEDQSGVLRKDAADEVILATGPDTEVHIARTDVAEMRPGTVSVMPQGLDEQLSRQELADLVAFLKNTRWGPQ